MKMMLKEFKISCNNLKEDRNVSKNNNSNEYNKTIGRIISLLDFASY